jgi:hypothetical protein
MTTIVLAHPDRHCPAFQVFGVYDGEDDRFVFDVRKFDDGEEAERWARRMVEYHKADHFRRSIASAM